jgi:hypothetical protein
MIENGRGFPESGRGTYIFRAQECNRTLLYKILEPPLQYYSIILTILIGISKSS